MINLPIDLDLGLCHSDDMTSAAIIENPADIDIFSSPTTVPVKGAGLREGMVLIDPELGCPIGYLDHKIGRATHGAVTFLVHDLDRGGWYEHRFHMNHAFDVVAA